MKSITILLVCAAVASATALVEKVVPRSLESRIVNGSPATLGQFPHHVGIFYWTAQGTFKCGGALINPNFVLTAAHCLEGATKIELHFGTTDFWGGTKVYAQSYSIHGAYDPQSIVNDIGLIKLASPIYDSADGKIRKINLPTSTADLPAGTSVTISGFGKTSDTTDTSTLMYTALNIYSRDECRRYFGASITDKTLCTIGQNGKSSCQGDSGGPLIINPNSPTHVGIVSFGGRSCQQGLPVAFTRTAGMLDWIQLAQQSLMSVKTLNN